MTTRSRMGGLALALTLSLTGTLAACGGSDDDSAASDPTSSAAPTAEAETTTPEPTADSGGDAAGKPSRDDVIAGYTKVITGTAGANLPDDIVKQVVTCFVDELYEPASAQTLQAIADADPSGVDPADAQLFGDASTTCTAKITG
ncbi:MULTISPECIES: hypothetical protein [unclassified Aeromicrobium]|uniref:hypothetical protein n=1 Tax=unclassified Aeromicrobium TaxID=2633570 RepID=UPI0012F9FF06|nr:MULTISPECIES: hypothetical protein [unclassified Aeromicrobium]MBD8608616.1 hypothetical protein [Aeromicrobium sp. CFBP 8757]